jgi:5-methylcytosine-specific restriction endonuclease McrA
MAVHKMVHRIRRAKPLTREEGMKILTRDRFRCQYCGLDGTANFENALMLTVDFVIPRSLKGKKDPGNLVTACRPCNVLKGGHRFASFQEAKDYVLSRREEERQKWRQNMAQLMPQKATA